MVRGPWWEEETYSNLTGPVLTWDASKAHPCVYPNKHGWPMIPDLDILGLHMSKQKVLLRRYFAASSSGYIGSMLLLCAYRPPPVARGGVQPSYKHIEAMMVAQPGSVISPSRLPSGITLLRDMKYWSRSETDAWIQHILQGQRGTLPLKHRFNWQLLLGTAKQRDRHLTCVTFAAEPTSRLNWTPEELLYTERIRIPSNSDHNLHKGVPYARTSHIYAPYTLDLFNALSTLHENTPGMRDLLSAIARMEELGPIHVSVFRVVHCSTNIAKNSVGFSDHEATSNPHVPTSKIRSLAKHLEPAQWLPCPFFDSYHEQHVKWSLTTFLAWITSTRPHIHSTSGTVYGGPLGVRVLVFALSRILQNVEYVQGNQQCPRDVLEVIKGPRQTWAEDLARHLVKQCIEVLIRDITKSRTILQVTYQS
jgi:hypothetical protein